MANATILQLRAVSQIMTIQGLKALNTLGSGGARAFMGGGSMALLDSARLAQSTVTKKGLYGRGAFAIAGVRQGFGVNLDRCTNHLLDDHVSDRRLRSVLQLERPEPNRPRVIDHQ